MRKLILASVLLLCVIFVIARFSEVEAILKTIREGDWRFLLIAVFVEAIWLINIAASYKSIFQATGIEEKMEKLVLLSSAAYFINVIAPTAGMSGIAIFVSEAKRRGYSPARVTVAGVLFVLFDYVGFFCILGLGLLVLFRRNHLNGVVISATIILVIIASVIAFLLYLGTHSVNGLGIVLSRGAHIINKSLWPFIHRDYLSEDRAKLFAQDASGGLLALRQKPNGVIIPFALALSSKALLVVILLLMFLAFNIPPTPGTIIAAFSLGYLFLIVSPTPAGIGFVEGGMTLALSSLGLTLGASAVVALAYRGVTFWIPLVIGMLSFRYLTNAKEIEPIT